MEEPSVSISMVCLAAIMTVAPGWSRDAALRRVGVCEEIAERSEAAGVPPGLAVSVSWHETSWRRDVVSPVGAHGPMQVMELHCGGSRCSDPVAAGLTVLRRYIDRYRDASGVPSIPAVGSALARYACGGRCTWPTPHATDRVAMWQRIEATLREPVCEDYEPLLENEDE